MERIRISGAFRNLDKKRIREKGRKLLKGPNEKRKKSGRGGKTSHWRQMGQEKKAK